MAAAMDNDVMMDATYTLDDSNSDKYIEVTFRIPELQADGLENDGKNATFTNTAMLHVDIHEEILEFGYVRVKVKRIPEPTDGSDAYVFYNYKLSIDEEEDSATSYSWSAQPISYYQANGEYLHIFLVKAPQCEMGPDCRGKVEKNYSLHYIRVTFPVENLECGQLESHGRDAVVAGKAHLDVRIVKNDKRFGCVRVPQPDGSVLRRRLAVEDKDIDDCLWLGRPKSYHEVEDRKIILYLLRSHNPVQPVWMQVASYSAAVASGVVVVLLLLLLLWYCGNLVFVFH